MEYVVSTLMKFLSSIPESFWGVIIGGIVSITTVYIANKNEIKKSKENLKDNLKQATISDCIDGIFSAVGVMGSLGDLSFEDAELHRQFKDSIHKISRAAMAASTDTMVKLSKFASELTELFVIFNTKRMELKLINSEVQTAKDISSKIQGQIEELIGFMRQLNLQGNTDQRQWDIVNRMIEGEQQLQNAQNQAAEEKQKALLHGQIALLQEMMESVPKFGEMQIELLSKVREEMGMEIAAEPLRRQLRENQDRMRRTLSTTIKRLEKMIEEEFEEQK